MIVLNKIVFFVLLTWVSVLIAADEILIDSSRVEILHQTSQKTHKPLVINVCIGRVDGRYEKILNFYKKENLSSITKQEVMEQCQKVSEQVKTLTDRNSNNLFYAITAHVIDQKEKIDAHFFVDDEELKKWGLK